VRLRPVHRETSGPTKVCVSEEVPGVASAEALPGKAARLSAGRSATQMPD
jgi:hypothetical protein